MGDKECNIWWYNAQIKYLQHGGVTATCASLLESNDPNIPSSINLNGH